MSSGLLPDHIEPLVNRLRAGDHLPIALPDVAAVTEILMRSLESYFKSIDLSLYKECQELADYIENARAEISSLSPDHDDSAGIPRAGQELDAIVEATESATDAIMQSAEDLMSYETSDFEEYKDHVNTEVLKIFEACSFQDITGQRISKVVRTLNDVEERVGKLITILGINNVADAQAAVDPTVNCQSNEIDEDDLLHGPALTGEGIDQGEVDILLGDTPVAESSPQQAISDSQEDIDTSLDNDPVVFEAPEEELSDSPETIDETISLDIELEDDVPSEANELQDDIAQNIPEIEEPHQDNEEVHTEEDDVNVTSQRDIDSLFG